MNVFHYLFQAVPDRSPFLNVPKRFWTLLNVPWAFSTVWDLIMTMKAQKQSWNGQKRWETVDAQDGSRTLRNGERSGTLDGLKRLQNHVHGRSRYVHVSKTKEKLYYSLVSLSLNIYLLSFLHDWKNFILVWKINIPLLLEINHLIKKLFLRKYSYCVFNI